MSPLAYLRWGGGIGIALALAWLWLGWSGAERRLDALQKKYDVLTEWSGNVIFATRTASDNPALGFDTTPGQIVALGSAHKALKFELAEQNRTIEQLARDAVAARAHAAELRKIADRAEMQRQTALKQLSDMALSPGSREDCLVLLSEAERALDIVYEAGL